jgi:hypothetical protein
MNTQELAEKIYLLENIPDIKSILDAERPEGQDEAMSIVRRLADMADYAELVGLCADARRLVEKEKGTK